MEYKLISNEFPGDLVKAVNKAIGEGWEPQGGIAIQQGVRYDNFYQVMIKSSPKWHQPEGGCK